jgi:Arc/MetJ family transcription regulator
MDRRISRRALLAGAALPLAACTQGRTPAPPDPDDLLRAEAVERERSLLREYDAVLLALPGLAARLVPLRGHHAEHLLALTGETATPSPGPSSDPVPQVPLPATAAAALAGLVEAERMAAAGHRAGALAASRELAALLASLAASEASHPVVLT